MIKPPYALPSMAEALSTKKNGFVAVSTFSGCGGSSLGYRLAGFDVLWASEFVEAARDTYAANFPEVTIDARDIREVGAVDILKATGSARGEIDLLDGSPPCASFSSSGVVESGWGRVKKYSDTKQRTDDLFFEFARIVKGVQPRVFVAENVYGLVKGKAKGYFKAILKALKGAGYTVEARVLDAQWLGVPQMRRRVIFMGVRKDIDQAPVFPKPLPYRYSILDAIPWIAPGIDPPTEALGLVENASDISLYAIAKEWDNLVQGQQSKRYINLVKPLALRPCSTITASGGSASAASVVHPIERRKFSIAEVKRLCSFPDDFKLTGSYQQQYERLGRAVPPLMMKAVAEGVADVLRA